MKLITAPLGNLGRPPRLGPDAYFAAAFGLVADRGHEGLTVAALCNRLGTTRGSFYHHFEDLDRFVEALATRWCDWSVGLFDGLGAEPDLRRRFELCGNVSFTTMGGGHGAFRAWATTNPVIAQAALPPHRSCQALSVGAFAEFTEDHNSGQVLGAMAPAMCVGFQLRPQPLDRGRWMQVVARLFQRSGLNVDLLQRGGRTELRVVSLPRAAPVGAGPGSVPPTAFDPVAPGDISEAGSTKDRYFLAARALLAQGGSAAVKAVALVERLDLTKGSFQHHFGGMPGFVTAFAEDWEQTRTARIAACGSERNPWRRLEMLNADLLMPPDPAETAWRAWAYTDPVVRDAVCRVDQLHDRALATTLASLGDDPAVGLLAEMTSGLILGLQQWRPPFEPELAARIAIEWMRRFLCIDAEVCNDEGRPTLAFRPR